MNRVTSTILLLGFLGAITAAPCPNLGIRFGGPALSKGVSIATGPWVELSTPTVELWVYLFAGNTGTHVLAGPLDSARPAGFGFEIVGTSTVALRVAATTFTTGSGLDITLPVNEWSHVAGSYDGATARVYLNGVEAQRQALSGPIQYAPVPEFWVGRHIASSGFLGGIDEMRVWSSVRSAAQIADNMRAWLPAQPGLVLYFPFNDGDGSAVSDVSGNGHDGVLHGGPSRSWVVTCDKCVAAAGQPGWCTPLLAADRAQEQLPDLVPAFGGLRDSMQTQVTNFAADNCALLEGCVGAAGLRKIIRFDTATQNNGRADLIMGRPETRTDLYKFDSCHGHYHFEHFATYVVFDSNGVELSVGRKQAFCLLDSERFQGYTGGGVVPQTSQTTCAFQGISAGWADVYPKEIDCQWIDVTGVRSGNYRMFVEMNVRSAAGHAIEELHYINNAEYIDFVVEGVCATATELAFTPLEAAAGAYVDPATVAGATAFPNVADDADEIVTIPFPFSFFCADYTTLYFNSNGLISTKATTAATARPDSTTGLYPSSVNCYWNDWRPSIGASVMYYHVSGAAGSRQACFTWKDIYHYGQTAASANPVTFQCCLHEGRTDVSFHFQDTDAGTAPHTRGAGVKVGVVGGDPTAASIYAPPGGSIVGPSSVSVGVNSQNRPPVVIVVGEPYVTAVGTPVTMDASPSYDPDGLPVEFVWYFADGREPAVTAVTTHVFSQEGLHTIRVVVKELGTVVLSTARLVNVTVRAPGVCGNGVCETATSAEDSCSCAADCPTEPCHCYPMPQFTQHQHALLMPGGGGGSGAQPGSITWDDPALFQPVTDYPAVADDGSFAVALPFAFPLYCGSYTTLYGNANGFLSAAAASGVATAYPADMAPMPFGPNAISGLWVDLNPAAGGTVTSHQAGAAPNRRVCVTWSDVPMYRSATAPPPVPDDRVTFQICVFEGGDVEVRYVDTATATADTNNGGTATVGVRGQVVGDYVTASVLTADVMSMTATRFARQTTTTAAPAPATTGPTAPAPAPATTVPSAPVPAPATTAPVAPAPAPTTPAASVCGNGVCDAAESTCSCSRDCPGEPVLPCTCTPLPYSPFTGTTSASVAGMAWTDPVAAGHTALALSDDGAAAVDMPFQFQYYCSSYSRLFVSANGFATFNQLSSVTPPSGTPYFFDLLALCWVDLNPEAGGAVYWGVSGAVGSRVLTVTWLDVPKWGGDPAVEVSSFQLLLTEGSNAIDMRFQKLYGGGGECALAVVGKDPSQAMIYAVQDAALMMPGLTLSLAHDNAAAVTPVASAGGPYSGTPGTAVAMTAAGSSDPAGRPLRVTWDFGDGTSGEGMTVTHVYSSAGAYTVVATVTATDAAGVAHSDVATAIASVTAGATAMCGDGTCSAALGEDSCWCPGDCAPTTVLPALPACTGCGVDPYYAIAPSSAAVAMVDPVGAGHTKLSISDDGFQTVAFPFTFRFFCYDYTVGYISDNIFLSVNTLSRGGTSVAYRDLIAPLWMDIDPAATPADGGIFWGVQGTAPNRVAVVTWLKVLPMGGGDTVTVQLQIVEGSSDLHVVYRDTVTAGNSATSEGAGAGALVMGKVNDMSLRPGGSWTAAVPSGYTVTLTNLETAAA